ncbi:MAG: signal peptidase II [Thiobacillaceae bacterium]|nr:signal peptidase II [Thiobacillaceae bacterium]MCX7673902.1 signal peptidase II [Thiobacillaceae bacterium]MDW8324612.1 signal peptidase II [Burkholderiales bacterium]
MHDLGQPAADGSDRRGGYGWLWLSALVLMLDQASKFLIQSTLAPHQDIVVVTPFFNLVHVHNTGAAFSLLADQSGWQRWLFLGLGLAASGFILWLLRDTGGRRPYAIALALILGGALGNVVDRLVHGHVIDFLDLHAAGWHWPAFNLADAAITVGAALLIWDALKAGARRPAPQDTGT